MLGQSSSIKCLNTHCFACYALAIEVVNIIRFKRLDGFRSIRLYKIFIIWFAPKAERWRGFLLSWNQESVDFVNVASYHMHSDISVDTSLGALTVDVSFGGAIYAQLDVAQIGLSVTPEHYGEIIAIGREIKCAGFLGHM